jgi:phosphoglycerate dehydrogenase-like enzyme
MTDTAPLRILMSAQAAAQTAPGLAAALGRRTHVMVQPGDDADLAFLSRDVTGLSTKHELLPHTQAFHDALRRPRNAHAWSPLIGSGLPRDLAGQTAVIVGWGPIGQGLGTLLAALGLRIVSVRGSEAPAAAPAHRSVSYEQLHTVLPQADWLLLACPLSERTRGLVDAKALATMPAGARVVNVARGEVVDEPALIDALRGGALAGAYLDVFAHEPLSAASPLWELPNVIVTPHTAGHSDGNETRVAGMFLDNLGRWVRNEPLLNRVA